MDKKTHRSPNWIIPVIISAVVVIAIIVVAFTVIKPHWNTPETTQTTTETTATIPTVDLLEEIESLIPECAASVVRIGVSEDTIGAGIILSKDGLILTNNHLVDGAASIQVTFNDGSKETATILERNPSNDIALLKVTRNDLTPVKYSTTALAADDIVFAFGFSDELFASAGRIINPNQGVKLAADNVILIMTDCAIDKSFSGSALFNQKGEAIGIVNAKYPNSETEDFCVSHALELQRIRSVIDDMVHYHSITNDWDSNPDVFDENNFDPDNNNNNSGNSGSSASTINFASNLSWDIINSIPIAKDSMTEEQLRQICLDYMRLQLTFTWKPSQNYTHSGKLLGVASTYGGLPYVSSSFGNLYKVMEYYDPITGVLDLSGGAKSLKIFGNQCSAATFWSWNRVCNTLTFGGTANALLKNGCIRVGHYTYDDAMSSYNEKSTNNICKDNGERVMYESYAMLKPADGIVCFQNNAGHLRMISAKPDVVRNPDGTIDGQNSTVTYMDQIKSWSSSTQANGSPYEIQGGLDVTISFYALYRDGYLPFTIAELNKQNTVESGKASLNHKGANVSVEQLASAKITGNYAVSSVRIIVINAQGTEVYNKNTLATGCLEYSYSMKSFVETESLKQFAGTGCTVKVLSRIGTGEEVTAYTGILS